MSERDEHAIPRYPLAWPSGWRRTPPDRRKNGAFRQPSESRRSGVSISAFRATERLESELERLGGKDTTMSSNVQVRLDGRPRSETEPTDPGVAVYFRFKGRATVLACDHYRRVADNIAAIAGHVEALRRIERYGVGTIEQALAGYKALPADSAADWRLVFGFAREARVTAEDVQTRYRELAKQVHPDKPNGSDVAFSHLGRAKEFALLEVLGPA